MKALFLILTAVIFTASLSLSHDAYARGKGSGSTHVRGYTKKNGTYVQPHRRTSPNNTKLDKYSTKGNTNPYTGKSGTVDPNSQGSNVK